MKKVLALITAAALLSFSIAKELEVKAPVKEWEKHINKLETIRGLANESNLPHQQVKFINLTIDSLEMLVIPQLQKQLSDTIKKK